MTIADFQIPLDVQHIVMDDVSWDFYEHLLSEIGDGHLRVTYDDGRLEIIPPLTSHERWGAWIGRLIELMCTDRSIHVESLGSTTFRSEAKRKGLEPDECFYIQHAKEASKLEDAFDAAIDPPPDLAVEIDITSRSVDREPIYAALGVPEIWRFDGKRLQVLHLSGSLKYVRQTHSTVFDFLPMDQFEKFVLAMKDKDQIRLLNDFRKWVASLPA